MPSSFEIRGAIAVRKLMDLYLPRSLESRLGFDLFPLTERNEQDLILERNGVRRGLQWARGEDGPTGPARLPGLDTFRVSPGYYGDHHTIREGDLLRLRPLGEWTNFQEEPETVNKATEYLVERFRDRAEKNIWDLLLTGKFEATNIGGVVLHRDMYLIDNANTPSVLFNVPATAFPIRYLRELIPAKQLGKSIRFSKGRIIMNANTFNTIFANTNPDDLGGRRGEYGATINTAEAANEILLGQGLPKIEIYDEGYYPDPAGAAFVRFIPDGKILLVGTRTDGEPLGEYRMTRCANNPGSKPGMFVIVKDQRDLVPANVIVQCGHNGGPVAEYPEGLICINAY